MNYKITLSFFFLVLLNLCYGQIDGWTIYTTPSVNIGQSFPNEYTLVTKYILADPKAMYSLQRLWSYSSNAKITKVEINPLDKSVPAKEIRVYRGPGFNDIKVLIKSKQSNAIMYKVQLYANKKYPKSDVPIVDILGSVETEAQETSSSSS